MSTPIVDGVNTSKTSDETHSLSGREPEGFGSAASKSSTAVTPEEVAIQIKAVTDPLTRQLEWLCDLMKELRQALSKRNEENSGLRGLTALHLTATDWHLRPNFPSKSFWINQTQLLNCRFDWDLMQIIFVFINKMSAQHVTSYNHI